MVGNEKVRSLIWQAVIGNHLAHAYLFSGPDGIGKMTMARIVAGKLLCEDPVKSDGEACGRCAACLLMAAGTHPDYHEIGPEGSFIKIEQIRKLQEQLSYRSFRQGWRIIVIRNAEKMTLQAANSFLKTLEEPQQQTLFILLTSNQQLLPDTIVSRCQVYKFSSAPPAEVAAELKKIYELTDDQAMTCAAVSDGCFGAAVSLAEDMLNNSAEDRAGMSEGDGKKSRLFLRQECLNWLFALPQSDSGQIIAITEEIAKLDCEQSELVDFLLCWLRDALVWKYLNDPDLLINRDSVDEIQKLADIYDLKQLKRGWETVCEAGMALNSNVNIKLTWEIVFLQLADRAALY